MTLKLVNATELRPGNFAIINGAPCIIKSMDKSKTGKHGASKARIEAIGILDDKKRIIVMPGTERIAVPMIEKRKAQVLSVNKEEKKAKIMDLENFETFDVLIATDLLESIEENSNAEYWSIDDKKIIKRLQ